MKIPPELSRDIDESKCYTCGKPLPPDKFSQMSFFGIAADYARFPRCTVNFCHECGRKARKRYWRAVELTKGVSMANAAALLQRSAEANKGGEDDEEEDE